MQLMRAKSSMFWQKMANSKENWASWRWRFYLIKKPKRSPSATTVSVWQPTKLTNTSIKLLFQVPKNSLKNTKAKKAQSKSLAISVLVFIRLLWSLKECKSKHLLVMKAHRLYSGSQMVRQSLRSPKLKKNSAAPTSFFISLKNLPSF